MAVVEAARGRQIRLIRLLADVPDRVLAGKRRILGEFNRIGDRSSRPGAWRIADAELRERVAGHDVVDRRQRLGLPDDHRGEHGEIGWGRERTGVGAVFSPGPPVIGAAAAERVGQPQARATPVALGDRASGEHGVGEAGVARHFEHVGQRTHAARPGVLQHQGERLLRAVHLPAGRGFQELGRGNIDAGNRPGHRRTQRIGAF